MANTADVSTVNQARLYRYLAPKVISSLFVRMPALYFMLMKTGAKTDVVEGIGMPDVKSAFSGVSLNKQQTMSLSGEATYEPIVHSATQIDTKTMGRRDTIAVAALTGSGATLTATVTAGVITAVAVSDGGTGYTGIPTIVVVDSTGIGAYLVPTVAAGVITGVTVVNGGFNYSNSPTLTVQAGASLGEREIRAVFKKAHYNTVGILYHEDRKFAERQAMAYGGTARQGRSSFMASKMDEMQANHTKAIGYDMIGGVPADQTAAVWSSLHGIRGAIASDNTYGGIDRSSPVNYFWRAPVIATSRVASWAEIDDAGDLYGCLDKTGETPDLWMVSPTLFSAYRSMVRGANQKVWTGSQLPKFGSYGFTGEALQINDAWMIREPALAAGEVMGLNLASWLIAFGRKFELYGPTDLRNTEGGKDADQMLMDTDLLMACLQPAANIRYTGVTPA